LLFLAIFFWVDLVGQEAKLLGKELSEAFTSSPFHNRPNLTTKNTITAIYTMAEH
jgi:hypothetical protein